MNSVTAVGKLLGEMRMAWNGFIGHEEIVERFRRSAEHGRLAGTYLFAGPPGIGKRTFALGLAQAILCEVHPERLLDPCGGPTPLGPPSNDPRHRPRR